MSFARSFALGQQIAGTALDAYYDAREKKRLSDVVQARPEEIQNAYTSQDAEQLHALANARDAQGNPYYTLEAQPDGSYGLRTNFAYQGQDGQMVQPGVIATGITPRARVVEFLGVRYAPEDLNDERIAALRARAVADIIAERDPVRGLQMRQAIKQAERDDERFGWERQRHQLQMRQAAKQDERDEERFGWERRQQPLQIQALEQRIKTGELALAEAEKAKAWEEGFTRAIQEYTGSPEQIGPASKFINTRSRSITLGSPDPKTGLVPLSVVRPDGSSVFSQLNFAEQARIYAAAKMLGSHPVQALKEIAAVNEDLAEAIARENQMTALLADASNDAVAKAHRMRIDEAGLRLGRASTGRLQRDIKAFTDAKGNVVMVDVNSLPVNSDGTLRIPLGLRPLSAKPGVDETEIIRAASNLLDQLNPRTGKPFTFEEAYAAVKDVVYGKTDPLTSAIIKALGSGGDPFAKPPTETKPSSAPAATDRPVGVIKPPRTGAEGRW